MGDQAAKRRGISFTVAASALVGVVIVAIVVALVVPFVAGGSDRRDARLIVSINEATFPDAAWCAYVAEAFDHDRDGYLSMGEAQAVVHIGSFDPQTRIVSDRGISGRGIVSLEGIERFPNLEMLVAADNAIKELDITGNPRLLEIDVRGNPSFSLTYAEQNKDAHILIDEGAQVTKVGARGAGR